MFEDDGGVVAGLFSEQYKLIRDARQVREGCTAPAALMVTNSSGVQ
jgi:hypothetical protein